MPTKDGICAWCNTSFRGRVREDRFVRNRYCSRKCYSKAKCLDRRNEGRICANCDAPLTRTKHGTYNLKYCSNECRTAGKQTRQLNRYLTGKGRWYEMPQGYLQAWIKKHPLSDRTGRVYQHHFNYYNSLDDEGRADFLSKKKNGWTLHHRNGKRADNRPENLQLRAPGKHPQGFSEQDMISHLQSIGYTVTK